ncbi:MAG: AMP-binding protein [Bryobacteraceae bacterium]|nr:AMP-binding protein [Bryobacteraceae bacterium]
MNLRALFRPSLEERPGDVGLEFGGLQCSFGELDLRSNRLANLLAAEGFESGDRIAVYLENSIEFIDIYLASIKLGLLFTPINILYRDREIDHILRDAEPRRLIAGRNSPALENRDALVAEDLAEAARRFSSDFTPCSLKRASPACLVYTSGTTGRPKGAILTHGNFAANARTLIDAWRLAPDDRLLLALPLFHVHGLGNGLHTWLALGYRTRLLDRFRKETIIQEFLDFRPTVFFGVPTMYERLLDANPDTARSIGQAARLFVSGSAPLPARTFERFRELYGHAILERYGMTETLMNISNPYDGERRPGTVGLPLPGVAVRLQDGEILVKGDNIFAGYWRQPEATAAAFTEDGWFRTGDVATRSEDGYYTLEGRRTELIITGGFNVYPREIEEFLREQPGVADAAVIGVPHAIKGEAPAAFIVLRPGATADAAELQTRCRAHMASFKVPIVFTCVDRLPRNALGKIQRHLLAQRSD